MNAARLIASRALPRTARPVQNSLIRRAALPLQQRAGYASEVPEDDPGMNGNYVNPPRVKRQFRDPYGDWWDKQERRNYGEPLHEDNDVLTIFSPEEYTHVTGRQALARLGIFILAVVGLATGVSYVYPDKPSAPRTFPGGLEEELGGKQGVIARKPGEDKEW